MGKKNLILKAIIVIMGLSVFSQSWSVEIDSLRIAVIWNSATDADGVPYGWNVGDEAIGKAQLKLYLASLERSIDFDSTFDTTNIPDVLTTNAGINGKLTHVRIYTQGSLPDYNNLKADYDGARPSAIIYINAGSEWSADASDTVELYDLLRDAGADEVGIMTIGDASATDAKNIDTSKTIFPVMGVQKTFRFKAFLGDTIREFQFMSDNDQSKWLIADTVVVEGVENDIESKAEYRIKRLNDDKVIYEYKNGAVTKDSNFVLADADVLHQYGEWSINAKAVEVIDNDLYAPEMNVGVYQNHDLILVTKKSSVFVAKASWSEKCWAGGSIIADLGKELPNIKNFGSMSGSNFKLDKDYIVDVPNIDNNTLTDKILVLKKGQEIEPATTDGTDDLKGGTYIPTYMASGFKDLKIKLNKTGNGVDTIFNEVFPSLKTVSSLNFQPWTNGTKNKGWGRVQADADIWAINEQLSLGEFDSIYVNKKFNKNLYYTAYLGDQVAGADSTPQWVKAPETVADFDKAAKSMRHDSLGYDQGGKLYHSISAVQKDHRRLVMLGFQPSYLLDPEVTKGMLVDATKWIGVDDYRLPVPKVTKGPIYARDTTLEILIDFSNNGDRISQEDYLLHYTVKYGTQNVVKDSLIQKTGVVKLDKVSFKLSDIGVTIDPNDTTSLEVIVDAWATVPDLSKEYAFDGSDTLNDTIDIYQLRLPTFSLTDGSYKGATVTDTIMSNKTTAITKEVDVTDVLINCKLAGDSTGTVTGNSSYALTISQDSVDLVAWATKDGYIRSGVINRDYLRGETGFGGLNTVIDSGNIFENGDGKIVVEWENPEDDTISVENYDIVSKIGNTLDTIDGVGDAIIIPLTTVDSLIAIGDTEMVVEDIIAIPTETGKDNGWISDQSKKIKVVIKFTKLEVTLTPTGGNFTGDTVVSIIVKDPTTGKIVTDAVIKVNGKLITGTTINITGDMTLDVEVTKTGWIPSTGTGKFFRISEGDDENSAYFDINADGLIDSVRILFDTITNKPDTIKLLNPINSGKDIVITDQSKMVIVGNKVLEINFADSPFQPVETNKPNTGFAAKEYAIFSGANFSGGVTVRDSVAPVVVTAEYRFRKGINRDELSPQDTLYIKLSEDVNVAANGIPFEYVRGESGQKYVMLLKMGLVMTGSDFNGYHRFIIDSLYDGFPYPGDSVRIRTADSVTVIDLVGNGQKNLTNRLVPMFVEAMPIDLKSTVLWIGGSEYKGYSNDSVGVNNPYDATYSFSGIDRGVFVILDPQAQISDNEIRKVKAVVKVFDALGNIIAVTEGLGLEGDGNIKISPINWKESSTSSAAHRALGIAWAATNSVGRPVGASSYKMVVELDWGGGRTDKINIMVNVRSEI